MKINKEIYKKIETIVRSEFVSDAEEDKFCYSYDAAGGKSLPDIVVRPGTAEEISKIIMLANEYFIPVIPRGSGSGFVGGSTPVSGGIVLVLTRMSKIIFVDEDNLTAEVEPGVITKKLQQEVEKAGLFYPPDPASLKFSTIGGNVAVNSGGPRAIKYGVTKDYILGLEAVLPTGEIIHTGVKTVKGVVGYDLTRLLIGSEGTLGVITKILLKLLPKPRKVRTALAIFPEVDDAARAVTEIIRSKIIPATLEFMDSTALQCVESYIEMGLPKNAGAMLLIEVDGDDDVVEKEIKQIDLLCNKYNAGQIVIAADDKEQEKLWVARRAISPALGRLKPTKINEDIVVPRNKIPSIIKRIRKIAADFNLTIINFGHAGDGNIHVNIMTDKHDKDEYERAEKAVKEIFSAVLDLEGTISGEHGVGLTKSPYIRMEVEPVALQKMKEIKKIFDPNNIMNPGKIF
ncbi:MAG TPA: FAD-linked oxidase C-terminal domain-containing protein [Nitrospinota bacterium]|nr:FAD-linked oxidase C-terminal domain-containing protein [Nitrospinota bacterium]